MFHELCICRCAGRRDVLQLRAGVCGCDGGGGGVVGALVAASCAIAGCATIAAAMKGATPFAERLERLFILTPFRGFEPSRGNTPAQVVSDADLTPRD